METTVKSKKYQTQEDYLICDYIQKQSMIIKGHITYLQHGSLVFQISAKLISYKAAYRMQNIFLGYKVLHRKDSCWGKPGTKMMSLHSNQLSLWWNTRWIFLQHIILIGHWNTVCVVTTFSTIKPNANMGERHAALKKIYIIGLVQKIWEGFCILIHKFYIQWYTPGSHWKSPPSTEDCYNEKREIPHT